MKTEYDSTEFDQAAEKMIELGNRLLDEQSDSDDWEVASGLLAGAIHFWLFSRTPCGDLYCDSCSDIDTAEKRVAKLLEEVREFAENSDYYHTPYDSNTGTA
jgi:ferritin-like metal-binding protein YciE